MLRVDEGADAAAPLRLRDDVVDERRLARGLGAEDLDDAAAGKAPDAEREIERERAGRDRADGHRRAIVHLHDRALSELALDLSERDVECFVLVHLHRPPRATVSRTSYSAPEGRSRERKAEASDGMRTYVPMFASSGWSPGRSLKRPTVRWGS